MRKKVATKKPKKKVRYVKAVKAKQGRVPR